MSARCLSDESLDLALTILAATRPLFKVEGQPSTGRNVAEQIAELAAQVDALARIVGDLIERTEADK